MVFVCKYKSLSQIGAYFNFTRSYETSHKVLIYHHGSELETEAQKKDWKSYNCWRNFIVNSDWCSCHLDPIFIETSNYFSATILYC